jgi:polar amino acid transport system substrate-binding protein
VLSLQLGLAGCAASKTDEVWQRIQAQGVWRVGLEPTWVPFEYVDGAGLLSGFDVELARELSRRLGLEVQFVANLGYDGLYDALTTGQADAIISAVVVDDSRRVDFAFSRPYFEAGQVLVVGPQSAGVETPEDLRGRVLAVELGSDGDALARRWRSRWSDLELLHTDSADAALDAVADGRAGAALTDRATALLALNAANKAGAGLGGLRISGKPVTAEQYAIVVRSESRDLLRALNAALADLQRDGTLQALERHWLGP